MSAIKHFSSSIPTIPLCRSLKLNKTLIYYQSTTTTSSSSSNSLTNEDKNKEIRAKYPLLDTNFNQYQIAYRYRRNTELLRGYFVYCLFSFNTFVNNQEKIAYWGRRILGGRLFKIILQLTTFGHFVGGETPQQLIPVINKLQKYNVQPILDYSVESDDISASSSSSSSNKIDPMHDYNTDKFIECIKTSHDICGPNNFVAIKVTALIQPAVLKKLNTLLKTIENRSLLPPLLELINQEQTNEENFTIFQQSVKLALIKNQNEISSNIEFSYNDLTAIYRLLIRLKKIAEACITYNIQVMVDAEQTYFQTAINYLATELQRYYNKSNVPFIHGTYQCYLKDALITLKNDLALAEKDNYIFAAKLVRGAYMDQERRLAREYRYEDLINPNFEATTQMYHTCLNELLKSTMKHKPDQVRIMIGSHNEDTIRYAIQKMKDYNIRHDSSIVSFASLYGMSDYIAFALANSGYKTYKYLPYGPIKALEPYLFRRAHENRPIFLKADKDRRFHLKVLKDRIISFKN